jgi:hypothetical protein
VAVLEEAIEHRRDRGDVAEELAPIVDGTVGSHKSARPLVAAHDDFEEILGGSGGELAHAEIVDDQQRHALELGDTLLAGSIDGGIGELFDQDVSFAVKDTVALADGGQAEGLSEVALSGARRAEEESVLATVDELAGGELEEEAAIHLLVEIEVEGVEGLVGLAKPGLLDAALEEPIGADGELVADEGREKVDGRHPGGLRFEDSGLEGVSHAAEAELTERSLQLDEIHRSSS